MYIGEGRVTDYGADRTFYFSVSAYHIKVWDKRNKPVFTRTPDMPEWLDKEHYKWIKLTNSLEELIIEL